MSKDKTKIINYIKQSLDNPTIKLKAESQIKYHNHNSMIL